jgi:hypothetical protein
LEGLLHAQQHTPVACGMQVTTLGSGTSTKPGLFTGERMCMSSVTAAHEEV